MKMLYFIGFDNVFKGCVGNSRRLRSKVLILYWFLWHTAYRAYPGLPGLTRVQRHTKVILI